MVGLGLVTDYTKIALAGQLPQHLEALFLAAGRRLVCRLTAVSRSGM